MTTETKTLMEAIRPLAESLKKLDERISELNHELKDMKSERQKISDQIVYDLEAHGITTSLGLPDGGTLKLETKTYPRVLDLDGFLAWAKENDVEVPKMQFNPSTFNGWYKEQLENGGLIPSEELVPVHIETRAKINKGGRK